MLYDLILYLFCAILILVIDMINELSIKQNLCTKFMGQTVVFEEITDSTNLLAKRNLSLDEGTLFIANCQTAGRGRLGREWSSQKDDGIYMSLLLKPSITAEDISKITLICGCAVSRVIKNSQIKYPNDIVIGGKKVCGILCEMVSDENKKCAVICGIGINVNNQSFDKELKDKATSLFAQTGQKQSRVKIIQDFLCEFEMLYEKFLSHGISPIMQEYRQKCVNIGKEVVATYQNKKVVGLCTDITDDGAIVIQADNEILKINTGEISVRGILGYI